MVKKHTGAKYEPERIQGTYHHGSCLWHRSGMDKHWKRCVLRAWLTNINVHTAILPNSQITQLYKDTDTSRKSGLFAFLSDRVFLFFIDRETLSRYKSRFLFPYGLYAFGILQYVFVIH